MTIFFTKNRGGKRVGPKKSRKGFTLIELLIAISIFMIFMVTSTNAFLQIIRAQKSANETRLMYSELRNFVDYVSNELREGGIDYFCYNQDFVQNLDFNQMALVRCEDSVSLTVDSNDNLRTISRDGLSGSILKFNKEKQTVCVKRFRNINDSWQPESGYEDTAAGAENCGSYQEFSFANLKVNDVRMEIYPKKDPKDPGSVTNLANQLQPMVRLSVDVGSKLETVKFDLKYSTLITSRN